MRSILPLIIVRHYAERVFIRSQSAYHRVYGLIILIFLMLPTVCYGALPPCWFVTNQNGTTAKDAPSVQVITFTSINVTLTNPPSNGQLINPPGFVGASSKSPAADIYIRCAQDTGEGLVPLYGTYSQPNSQVFAPAPGVAYQIRRSNNPLKIYPTYTIPTGTTPFTNTTTFGLYSTGVLPSNGNQIPNGTLLGTWNVTSICISKPVVQNGALTSCGTAASNYAFMQFVSGGVTFRAPTCSVTSGNLTTTLPTVSVGTLGPIGGTAGAVPVPPITFGACQTSGLNVSLTINAPSTNISGDPSLGVLLATGGTATGVGIQVLQSDDSTPVTLNSPFATGITTNTTQTFSVQLFARYYHISNPVTPGSVQATATYSLSYQ